MRFGICTNATNLDYVKSLGYDYVELSLSDVAAMTDEEFEAVLSAVNRAEIYAETFNSSFPASLKMANDVDMDAVREYAELAFERAQKLGGKIVVVGSGKARMLPDCYDKTEAEKNFCAVLVTLAEIAERYGLKLAIEPLSQKATNFINTVSEGARICEMVNMDSVRLLADLYHVYLNGEDINDVKKYGKHIIHIHVARRNEDRGAPTMDDVDSIREFTDVLRDMGYDERITVEGKFRPDFETASKATIELLKYIYE